MLGIGAEWISWRLRWPSILVLLVVGVVAGPIIGIFDPRILFSGGVLAPIVAISVAIILFEGALSLKLTDLRQIGELSLFSTGNSPTPRPGQTLISLVNAGDYAAEIDRVAGAAPADEDA